MNAVTEILGAHKFVTMDFFKLCFDGFWREEKNVGVRVSVQFLIENRSFEPLVLPHFLNHVPRAMKLLIYPKENLPNQFINFSASVKRV